MVFISYDSIGPILDGSFVAKENLVLDENRNRFQLNSKVISTSIGCMEKCSLTIPVNFTFQHIQVGKKSSCLNTWKFLFMTSLNPVMEKYHFLYIYFVLGYS